MTEYEQLVEQLDAEIRAIEAADPTETSGAALLRGAKEEIERLEAALIKSQTSHAAECEASSATILKLHDAVERAEKAKRELTEAQAETWKADGEAERELAESKEEARELRQINAQAIKGRIACSDLLAEARARDEKATLLLVETARHLGCDTIDAIPAVAKRLACERDEARARED